MYRNFILLVLSLVGMTLQAQDSLSVSQHLEDYDLAVKAVEENYAGYPNKVDAETSASYESMKARLRKQVEAGERHGFDAAAEYTGWFGDFHLFLFDNSHNLSQQYYPAQKAITYHKEMEYKPAKTARKVTDETFLIRFPSCQGTDPTMEWIKESIDSFLNSGCANLILDIRGNTGGQDKFYQPYWELLYDHVGEVDGIEFRNSEENRKAYIQLQQDLGNPSWVQDRMKRIFASDEPFVLLMENRKTILQCDTIFPLPKKAALIIDRCVASSGEQLVLDVRATSNRTTVYGCDNTLGCLDFSNVHPDTQLPNSKVFLAIPTTRSCRLPDRSVDETGIAPDVRIPLPLPASLTDNIDEWVQWVAAKIEKQ